MEESGMNCFSPRHWALFFDLFESLPRQGPGNRESAARALAMCGELPPAPRILDLGCGVGGQTLHLSAMTSGLITAVDSDASVVEDWLTKRGFILAEQEDDEE